MNKGLVINAYQNAISTNQVRHTHHTYIFFKPIVKLQNL